MNPEKLSGPQDLKPIRSRSTAGRGNIQGLRWTILFVLALALTRALCPELDAGPVTPGTKLWETYIGGSISVPSIGHNGQIYVVSIPAGSSRYGILHALAEDGTGRWRVQYYRTNSPGDYFDFDSSGIVVCPNGNLIVGSGPYRATRLVSADGTTFYRDMYTPAAVGREPVAVNGEGQVFGCAYKLNATLTVKDWIFANGFSFQGLALGTNGDQYVFSNVQNGYKLYSIDPTGSKNWELFQPGAFTSPLALDSSDNIRIGYVYTNNAFLLSFTPAGRTNWQTRIPIESGYLDRLSQPVIGPDGTTYITFGAVWSGSDLWAVRSDGTIRWSAAADIQEGVAPAVASDGTLIAPVGNRLLCFDRNGTANALFTLTGPGVFTQSIVVDERGVILAPASDGYLYAIQGPAPLAESGWPMLHHDPRHTSSRTTAFGELIPSPATNPPFAAFPTPGDLVSNAATFVQQNANAFSPASREFLTKQTPAVAPLLDASDPHFLKRTASGVSSTLQAVYRGYSAVTAYTALMTGDNASAFLGLTSLVTDLNDPGAEAMMNGVQAVYDGVTISPVYGLIGLNAYIWGDLLADQLVIYGNDPLSPDYSVPYRPQRLEQCPIRSTGDVHLDESITNAFLGSYDAVAFLRSVNIAADRYAAAYASADVVSLTVQLEAFLYYLRHYNESIVSLEQWLYNLRDDLDRLHLANEPFTEDGALYLQGLPWVVGMHPTTESILLALGKTTSEITGIKSALETVDLPNASGTLADQVTLAAESMGQLCARDAGPRMWWRRPRLCWPASDKYVLQVADGVKGQWSQYQGSIFTDGSTNSIEVTSTAASRFYRLRKVR